MEYIERQALHTVLDFVERWNKQDKETDVAEAARELSEWLAAIEVKIKNF